MKIYKVTFENNIAVSVILANDLHHGDMAFGANNHSIDWFAIECKDEETAIEVADKAIKMIWGK
jgi:hypothetical protein